MNHENLEKETIKKYSEKDKRKRKRMHQSGKSVLQLQQLIIRKNDRASAGKNNQKN